MIRSPTNQPGAPPDYTTIKAARVLGLAVRSVQLMADRGEIEAWKTPGGHRRITHASIERWLVQHGREPISQPYQPPLAPAKREPSVLLIEDSAHFQKLVSLVLSQYFPQLKLHIADDGIAGLAMAGKLDPDILIVDILLPGIDGATLIATLRTHSQFEHCRLIVITSLDEAQREPYAFALERVPVIHKSRLAAELPACLRQYLAELGTA